MFSSITDAHSLIWTDIDTRLSPLPQGSTKWKTVHALPLIAELPIGLLLSCVQIVNKTLGYVAYFFTPQIKPKDFTPVLQDAREWDKLGSIEEQITLGHGNPNFLFGTATCTYQDSGLENCPDSQWAPWEKKKLKKKNQSGKSADLFKLYQTDDGLKQLTDRLHTLGVNSYRFSLEWSHIEPEEGKYDALKFQTYINLCKHLRNEGIAPMITLHHFSEPLWFHKKGSFASEENVQTFVNFARIVIPDFTTNYKGKPLVENFCTINEPAIDAFSRFIRGVFSPGKVCNFKKAAQYLKGALRAHCLAYESLKPRLPESVQIGIVHQYLKFTPTNPLLFPVTSYLTRFVNDTSLNFFSTGVFKFSMPFVNVTDNEMPEPQTDFVGLQYYTRPVVGLLGPTSYHAPMTQMPFHEDPEGLFEAIVQTHRAYNAPVIVTENGISTHDDKQRERYILRALYAAQQAADLIGRQNLRGYHLWSFNDNFEWDMGMKPQAFGAFTLEGKLKKGAKAYSRVIEKWHATLQEEEKKA